jgi:hypothetical protein
MCYSVQSLVGIMFMLKVLQSLTFVKKIWYVLCNGVRIVRCAVEDFNFVEWSRNHSTNLKIIVNVN